MSFQESSFRSKRRTINTAIAGLSGGVIAFALSEPYNRYIDANRDFTGDMFDIIANTGVWFALIILGIGASITAADAVVNQDWKKAGFLIARAAPFLIVGGLIAGYIAQIAYQNLVDFEAVSDAYDQCFDANDRFCAAGLAAQMPGRAIGWGIAGMLGGIPIGLAASSRRLAQNGAIGGLVGGLLGGAAFDPVGVLIVSGPEGISRLVGVVLIGTLIGVAFSVITAARTSAYVEVLNGDFVGTQFPINDAVTLVGCASNAAITLRGDRGIKEHHFELHWDGDSASFVCVRNSPDIDVDGVTGASGAVPLGAVIKVGSTELRLLGSRAAKANFGGTTGAASTAGKNDGSSPDAPAPDRPNISTRDVPAPPPEMRVQAERKRRTSEDRPNRPTIRTKPTDPNR